MLDSTKQILDEIITKQEGGWVLTNNANDPDGGWTYAGMTARNCCKYQGYPGLHDARAVVPFADWQKFVQANCGGEEAVIRGMYDQFFIKPSRVEELPAAIQFAYLSCAINRGVGNAVIVLQDAINGYGEREYVAVDGKFGSTTLSFVQQMAGYPELFLMEFCHQWRLQYAKLVIDNAVAWHEAATYSEDPAPTIFRANDLIGWLNRIHYCETR